MNAPFFASGLNLLIEIANVHTAGNAARRGVTLRVARRNC